MSESEDFYKTGCAQWHDKESHGD